MVVVERRGARGTKREVLGTVGARSLGCEIINDNRKTFNVTEHTRRATFMVVWLVCGEHCRRVEGSSSRNKCASKQVLVKKRSQDNEKGDTRA